MQVRTRKLGLIATTIAALMCASAAPGAEEHVTMNADAMKWMDAPPALPKGAKFALLNGDPSKSGSYTVRLKTPAGYKVPPHWHSQAENLTIISGALYLGVGDTMSTAEAKPLRAGGYHYLPAKAHHFAYTKVPTVIQITGEGPFDIQYLDPKDDPQKAAMR